MLGLPFLQIKTTGGSQWSGGQCIGFAIGSSGVGIPLNQADFLNTTFFQDVDCQKFGNLVRRFGKMVGENSSSLLVNHSDFEEHIGHATQAMD